MFYMVRTLPNVVHILPAVGSDSSSTLPSPDERKPGVGKLWSAGHPVPGLFFDDHELRIFFMFL